MSARSMLKLFQSIHVQNLNGMAIDAPDKVFLFQTSERARSRFATRTQIVCQIKPIHWQRQLRSLVVEKSRIANKN